MSLEFFGENDFNQILQNNRLFLSMLYIPVYMETLSYFPVFQEANDKVFWGALLSAEPHSYILKTLKISLQSHHVNSAENEMRAGSVV